ncbi:hypothetical protein Mx9_p90 [Myxococcus phage Mx9]|nr:hypothetical protein Mx9_p90 [Myxococcus phage Mx9]
MAPFNAAMQMALAQALRGAQPPQPPQADVNAALGLEDDPMATQRALADAVAGRAAASSIPPGPSVPDQSTGAPPQEVDFAGSVNDAMARQAAMAQALRGQRAAGNLGLLTGDRVLQRFGQAQLDQSQAGDPNSLRYLSLAQAQQRLQQQAAAEARQGRQGDARLGLAREQYGTQAALGWGNLSQRRTEHADEIELERLRAERRRQEQLEADVKALGGSIADAGVPEFFQRIDVAKGIFEKYPDDLPGFGKGGIIPDRALNTALTPQQATDARKLRMAIGQSLASYQKFITGAGASDAERENLNRITGLVQSGNEESVRLGAKMLEEAMASSVRARAAAHTPEAVEVYGRRVPRIGNILRVGATDALPKGADGLPTLDGPTALPRRGASAPEPTPSPAPGAKARPLNSEPFVFARPANPKPGGVYMFNPKGNAFWVPEKNVDAARKRGWKDVP